MVLRSVLESFSSQEMLYTAVIHCKVEITGTRQVRAYFKVHFLNWLGETMPSGGGDKEFPVLLTLLPPQIFILAWGLIQHT
jgi:hypothetical protein